MLMRVPDLPHRDYSHAPRTCSPSLKIELTSTWSHQSKLSMTSWCRRSWNRFWRKSTEGKSKRVKSNSCGQQDRGGHLLQSYLQNIQRNLKKKLMKTTRLGFPMTCALSYISIVLPDIVPDGWYFYMFVTQQANSYMHSWLLHANCVECYSMFSSVNEGNQVAAKGWFF